MRVAPEMYCERHKGTCSHRTPAACTANNAWGVLFVWLVRWACAVGVQACEGRMRKNVVLT
jgi:hypothetical protein